MIFAPTRGRAIGVRRFRVDPAFLRLFCYPSAMHARILLTVAHLGIAAVAVTCLAGSATLLAKESTPAASAPQEAASRERIDKLVRELGDKDYYARQKAQNELARLGFEALEALDAATTNEDLEIASRAKYLLRLMRVEWAVSEDSVEVKNCLRNYESLDSRSRESRMEVLARLPDAKGTAALCRLVRFERSPLLSKTAAVVLMFPNRVLRPPHPVAVEIIRKNLASCKRPGALWLTEWTRLAADPKEAMAHWQKLIDAEMSLLNQKPEETSEEIVARLTRFQVAWLKRLGQNEEAMTAIRRLVMLEPGDAQSVAELLDWLIQQKAWKAVDELAKRFSGSFASEPPLLYMLAQSYAARGQQQRAKETAQRAFRMYPGKQDEQLLRHFTTARQLRNRGQFDWARREYEHVTDQAAEGEQLTAMSRILLSEMLHEQGENFDAAAVIGKLVEGLDAGKVPEGALYGRDAKEIRALKHYYSACHWASKGNVAKQRAALDKALEADPEDLDSLIAGYHLPAQSPAYHAKIVAAIKETAVKLHDAVEADPQSAVMYNQYAWLVGNTEGDFDEALRCSLKSVELRPDEGGYYDTLAHVYAGKGDYENAVKHQTRAAELEPHSGLIRVKLDVFRKKLEEKKKTQAEK
jgi:tetratricopeptide (TPR) repeat protein